MRYNHPFQVEGFHSCDQEVGLKVLNGQMDLKPSLNPWDWLGHGVYFWEYNPGRALQYATECAAGMQKNKIRIRKPMVLGAIVELGKCLNLLESESLSMVKVAHKALVRVNKEFAKEMPVNKGARRELDCAVINYVHELIREAGLQPYDTVRCAFQEGEELYKGASATQRQHVELCVINKEMIKGYFLPRPIPKFNPQLN